jgi:hypothetical protein
MNSSYTVTALPPLSNAVKGLLSKQSAEFVMFK